MLNTPFPPWPSFTEEEAEAVRRVLLSNKVNYWTGNEGRAFEEEFAAWLGCKHAVTLANGTVALDLALKMLGIGPGDEVVVTPRTFLASASSVVNAGATPVFADVDADSQNIKAETIREVLTPRTRGIICVHLAGWPCEMDEIMALAEERGLYVIEDCAQAHGAKYKGRAVGTIGHFGAWSFCQDKIMTTGGEGGMLTTNDKTLWLKAWSFKDHGKSWDAVYHRQHPSGFRWLHDSFGTNWRLTEMQSAIGRIQLRKIDQWVESRRQNASVLNRCFSRIPILRVTDPPSEIVHSYYKYYVFVRPEMLKSNWNRDRILEAVHSEGIPCFTGSCSEIYLEKAFDRDGLRPKQRLRVAKELGENALMFLVHPTLREADILDTCRAVEKVMSTASRYSYHLTPV
jgi:dTDP-4-amino-4,6-dideoxygalactose transaminase